MGLGETEEPEGLRKKNQTVETAASELPDLSTPAHSTAVAVSNVDITQEESFAVYTDLAGLQAPVHFIQADTDSRFHADRGEKQTLSLATGQDAGIEEKQLSVKDVMSANFTAEIPLHSEYKVCKKLSGISLPARVSSVERHIDALFSDPKKSSPITVTVPTKSHYIYQEALSDIELTAYAHMREQAETKGVRTDRFLDPSTTRQGPLQAVAMLAMEHMAAKLPGGLVSLAHRPNDLLPAAESYVGARSVLAP